MKTKTEQARRAGAGAYAVLRHRDFVLHMIGRLIGVLCQQMMVVAVGWSLYERTHSALALGLVGLTNMIAMVGMTLPAGHTADNFNRKRIVLLCTVAVALGNLGLAAVSAARVPVAWTYLCLFWIAAARTFLWPASAAFVVSLVPRELFPYAVTWNTATFQLASVVGPALGGGLIAFFKRYVDDPTIPVFCLNSLGGIITATLVYMIRTEHTVSAPEPMTFRSLATGFRFVFSHRLILAMLTLDLFAVLFGGAVALLPVYARDILKVGPAGLGLLEAATPLGAILCAVAIAHMPPFRRAGRALIIAVVVFGLSMIVFGLSRAFPLSFLALVVSGAADNVSVVVRHTSVQLLTPDDKRGRVSAVNSLFIGTSNELGGFESGLVAHWFGPVFSVVSGGVATLVVVAAVAWVWPELRRYGPLVSPAAEFEPEAERVRGTGS